MSEATSMGTPLGGAASPIAMAKGRWLQLLLGFIVMMTISSPQYVWTLFTSDFQKTTGAVLSQVQWTLTILIVIQTWLSPVQGWLVDRFGPKLLIGLGTVLSGLGWVAASQITALTGLYASYGLLCGIGTGIVYIGIVGLMVKWFPDRRGFATGIVAAGYGFGAMFTTFPIAGMIKALGYRHTLLVFGVVFAAIGLLVSLLLRAPRIDAQAASRAATMATTSTDYSPAQMLKTPVFWLMFLMFTMMSTGGLMVLSNFVSFAKSFGIDGASTVTILGATWAAIPAALTFDRVTNGLTRPFFGWVSDTSGAKTPWRWPSSSKAWRSRRCCATAPIRTCW